MNPSGAQHHRQIAIKRLLAGAGLCATTAVLAAGCGGSSPKPTAPGPVQRSHPTAALSNADVGGAQAQQKPSSGSARSTAGVSSAAGSKHHSHAAASSTIQLQPVKVQKAHETPSTSKDDLNQKPAPAQNPCGLVSVSEARSITQGSIVTSVEAPLGPTCIYRGHGPKVEVTMTIETLRYSQATRHLSHRTSVSVGTRKGACGRLGRQMLFVPAGLGKVLNVIAPCGVAKRFATLALSHLTA